MLWPLLEDGVGESALDCSKSSVFVKSAEALGALGWRGKVRTVYVARAVDDLVRLFGCAEWLCRMAMQNSKWCDVVCKMHWNNWNCFAMKGCCVRALQTALEPRDVVWRC